MRFATLLLERSVTELPQLEHHLSLTFLPCNRTKGTSCGQYAVSHICNCPLGPQGQIVSNGATTLGADKMMFQLVADGKEDTK